MASKLPQMENELPQKHKQFVCDNCDFITGNKKDYSRHMLTPKHLKMVYLNENASKSEEKASDMFNNTPSASNYTCNCGKEYKHDSSFYRHKKKCTILNQEETAIKELKQKEKEGITLKMTDIQGAIPNMDMNLIFAFMKDTQEFKQMMLEQSNIILEQNKIMTDLVGKVGNTNINSNNNTQNNQFNLNFFLNDTCKGAMNVKDFMNFINVDLEDIEYIGKHGYVAGISRIFTKNLARLGKFEKPIWVTDEKRETIMYKEDGEWKKDDDHIKMNKISVAIEFKCIKALTIWRELNPDWREDEKKGEFLNIMNGCVFGGELKTPTIFYHPPDKDQKAKIVRSMIQHLKIPKNAQKNAQKNTTI